MGAKGAAESSEDEKWSPGLIGEAEIDVVFFCFKGMRG